MASYVYLIYLVKKNNVVNKNNLNKIKIRQPYVRLIPSYLSFWSFVFPSFLIMIRFISPVKQKVINIFHDFFFY